VKPSPCSVSLYRQFREYAAGKSKGHAQVTYEVWKQEQEKGKSTGLHTTARKSGTHTAIAKNGETKTP
jgi:hypothetical protein